MSVQFISYSNDFTSLKIEKDMPFLREDFKRINNILQKDN